MRLHPNWVTHWDHSDLCSTGSPLIRDRYYFFLLLYTASFWGTELRNWVSRRVIVFNFIASFLNWRQCKPRKALGTSAKAVCKCGFPGAIQARRRANKSEIAALLVTHELAPDCWPGERMYKFSVSVISLGMRPRESHTPVVPPTHDPPWPPNHASIPPDLRWFDTMEAVQWSNPPAIFMPHLRKLVSHSCRK